MKINNYLIYDKKLIYVENSLTKLKDIIRKNSEIDVFLFRVVKRDRSFIGYLPPKINKSIDRREFIKNSQKNRSFFYGAVKEEYYVEGSAVNNILANNKIEKIMIIDLIVGYYDGKLNYTKREMYNYRYSYLKKIKETDGIIKFSRNKILTFANNKIIDNKEIKFRKKNFILLSDGMTHAQDNAEIFAQYLKNKNIKNYGYVLEKNSYDYERLKKEGINIIKAGSKEHKIYSLFYRYFLGSYFQLDSYSYFVDQNKIAPFRKYLKGNKVFLEHGITYNDHSKKYLNKRNSTTDVDYYICGAREEYEALEKIKNFNFVYTGLPRHDKLLTMSKKENKIFVFLTWRRYLDEQNSIFSKKFHIEQINKLLNSKRLREINKMKKTKINLFLHKNYFNFSDELKIPEHINLIDFQNSNIQYEMATSAMLITDFSSVQFEFFIQNKPVINFQHDREAFFGKHYDPLLSLEDLGLTNVCENIDEFDKKLNDLSIRDFEITCENRKNNEKFFGRIDTNNCARLYRTVLQEKKQLKSIIIDDKLILSCMDQTLLNSNNRIILKQKNKIIKNILLNNRNTVMQYDKKITSIEIMNEFNKFVENVDFNNVEIDYSYINNNSEKLAIILATPDYEKINFQKTSDILEQIYRNNFVDTVTKNKNFDYLLIKDDIIGINHLGERNKNVSEITKFINDFVFKNDFKDVKFLGSDISAISTIVYANKIDIKPEIILHKPKFKIDALLIKEVSENCNLKINNDYLNKLTKILESEFNKLEKTEIGDINNLK